VLKTWNPLLSASCPLQQHFFAGLRPGDVLGERNGGTRKARVFFVDVVLDGPVQNVCKSSWLQHLIIMRIFFSRAISFEGR
jgi:hypothetical protein